MRFHRALSGVSPTVVSLFALLAILSGTDVLASQGGKAGWIETAKLQGPISNVVRIIRGGGEVAYSESEGLRACDRIKLLDEKASLRVTLSNAQRLNLSASRPEVVVPCNTPGFAERIGNVIQAITGQAEKRRAGDGQPAIAATRGQGALAGSRTYVPLGIPVLVAETAEIAEGKRAIFVSWRGGLAPFRVEVLRTEADGKVTTIASQDNVRQRSVTLPEAKLPVGRYSLVITGKDNSWIREDKLDVVSASSLPAMPAELKAAKLADSVRTLYYADFLVGFEDGRFTLEALQQAASISPATPASRDWLSAWGSAE